MTPTYLLWIGIAIALIYLPMSNNTPSWARSLAKTAPLLVFALAAWLARAPDLLLLGFVLSALGDYALSRRGDGAFLYGLAAFAVAQVVYLALFLGLSGRPIWSAFSVAPVLAVFLAGIALSTELWLVPHVHRLRWPVRVYVTAISGMGFAALTVPLGEITLGAALLIASDLLLALQLFRMGEDNPLVGPAGWVVWGTYITGQALVLAGAA